MQWAPTTVWGSGMKCLAVPNPSCGNTPGPSSGPCKKYNVSTVHHIIMRVRIIEIEGQRGKDDVLKRYLGVWQHSPYMNFSTSSTLECTICRIRFLKGF